MLNARETKPPGEKMIGFFRWCATAFGTVESDGEDPTGPTARPRGPRTRYCVKTDDDAYRISIAVAGFSEKDLIVEVKESALVVAAKKSETKDAKSYLHRGIATRSFERKFDLADHVRVIAASYADGMLNIDLKREVPEALKPRRIEIESVGSSIIDGTSIN